MIPNDGYILESLILENDEGNKSVITNNQFLMPNSNVKIFASFKQMEQQDVVDNPSTFDNILFYVGMGTVSVIGLIFIGLKMFNNKKVR